MTSLSKYANCARQQFPLQGHKTLDRILCLPKGKRVCMDCIGWCKELPALAGTVIKFKVVVPPSGKSISSKLVFLL